jgi:hypothetical protein
VLGSCFLPMLTLNRVIDTWYPWWVRLIAACGYTHQLAEVCSPGGARACHRHRLSRIHAERRPGPSAHLGQDGGVPGESRASSTLAFPCLAISPRSRLVLAACQPGLVRLWPDPPLCGMVSGTCKSWTGVVDIHVFIQPEIVSEAACRQL